MPLANLPVSVPLVVDEAKCIADKGCAVCVDVCLVDVLFISDVSGNAYMKYDECWYCMPCDTDCPTGAVTVHVLYLLRRTMPVFESFGDIEELSARLADQVPAVRGVAVIELGDSTVLPYLETRSGDLDPDARKTTRWAIGRLR